MMLIIIEEDNVYEDIIITINDYFTYLAIHKYFIFIGVKKNNIFSNRCVFRIVFINHFLFLFIFILDSLFPSSFTCLLCELFDFFVAGKFKV